MSRRQRRVWERIRIRARRARGVATWADEQRAIRVFSAREADELAVVEEALRRMQERERL